MQRHIKNFLIAFVIVFALGPAVFLALYTDRYAQGQGAAIAPLAAIRAAQIAGASAGATQSAAAAAASVPVQVLSDIPKERDSWQQILLSGLENAAYGFLKSLSRRVAIEMAQGAVKTIALGAGGKEPLFHTKPWDQYLKEASLDAGGFFLEGAVQGWKDADFVEKLKKDQDVAKKFESEVLPALKESKKQKAQIVSQLDGELDALRLQKNPLQDQLRNCDPNDNLGRCGSFRAQLEVLNGKIHAKEPLVTQAKKDSSKADTDYSKGESDLPLFKKRSDEAKKTYAQIPQDVLERRLKYQEGDQQGGFSESARDVIATACNPNQLFLLNLTIGLGFTKSSDLKPTCNLEDAYKNWNEAFQNSIFYNVSMRELLNQQANGWKTAQSMINPFGEPDVAVAFKLNLIDHEEKIEKSLVSKLKRTEETPFKPITTLGGIIKTPSEIVRNQALSQINKANEFDTRLYGKIEVDLVDIALTFTESLFGRLGEIWMEGLQYAPELAYGGASLRASFTGNKLIYSQGGLPVFNRERIIEAQTVKLAQLNYERGTNQNVLLDLQSKSDQNVRSRVIDRAFAQAITLRLSVDEAIKKYDQTNKSVGLNPDGVFGFKFSNTPGSAQEPDYDKGYPYRSLVILRKYRVIPVSWELAALYIKKNPDICSVGGCTLKYLVDQFNEPASPFYRLIDPHWVLKLPPVRCELKGYGPPVPGEPARKACLADTNGDGLLACQVGNLTHDWLRSTGYTFLIEKLQKLKESCNNDESVPFTFTPEEEPKIPINHPLREYINKPCSILFYGDPDISQRKNLPGILDEEETIQRRAETCVDEQTCLFDDGKGGCKERDYGYCLEERKRWQFEGNECRDVYQSCDIFVDKLSGEENYYLKDKLPPNANDVCKAQNAGCQWYSKKRNVGSALNSISLIMRGGTPVVEEEGEGANKKTVYAIQEWDKSQNVYLNAQAKVCSEDSEGCTRLTCLDGDGECLQKAAQENRPTRDAPNISKDRYFKLAPEYYKCALTDPLIDKKPSYKRTECKPFALNCTQEFEGCQRYQATNGDPSVAAPRPSLQICKQECNGLSSFVKTATDFETQEPTNTNDLITFIPTKVQMCPSTEVGCDEFTNLDKKEQGGESLEYYSHLQLCEKTPTDPTVFYTYYGSDTSGYKPEKVFLKPDTNGNPACGAGASCVCDESTFTSQKANPNSSFTCREFINVSGGKSYRHWDKVVYQSDDCHPYRRTLDGANGQVRYATQQFGLSKTCSAQNKGCREYKSGRAGNVFVSLYDNFENKTTTDWDVKHPVQYSAVPSSEAETLDNTSLLLEARENQTPEIMELKKKVDITLNASYQFVLGMKASAGNKLTVKLIREVDNAQTNEVVLGTISTQNDSWQHVKFFAPHVTFGALKTEGGFVVITIEKGTGTLPKVLLDDIALKKMEGVVYAINSSTLNEKASPTLCRANITTELNCQEYKTPQGMTEYFSAVGKLCPTELVGCKKFMQEQVPVYIVDDQSKLCPRTEEYCTAYGQPKLVNKKDGSQELLYEKVNSTRNVGGTQTDVVQKTFQWETVYYKVTPQQVENGTTSLQSPDAVVSPESKAQVYNYGICLSQENGCRAYDTKFASKAFFLKSGNKVSCSVKEEGDKLKWTYKTCSKPGNSTQEQDANISCKEDTECESLFGGTSKCSIELSCDADPQNPQATQENYLYQCKEEFAGCRKIHDPECIQAKRCSETSIRCDGKADGFCNEQAQRDAGSSGTCVAGVGDYVLKSDYGRGISDIACKPDYYYLADLQQDSKSKTQRCENAIDVERGCLLFQDSNGGANTHNSSKCYDDYNKDNARVPQTSCAGTLQENDANTIFKVKTDRECRTWLACVAYEQVVSSQTGQKEIRCTMRLPCRKKDPLGSECDETGILYTPGRQERNVSALKKDFSTPFSQGGASATDFSLSMLSGLSRPDLEFKKYNAYEAFKTTGGHDSYFLPGGKDEDKNKWVESVEEWSPPPPPTQQNAGQQCFSIFGIQFCNPLGQPAPQAAVPQLATSQKAKIATLGVNPGENSLPFVVNSCRLYPDEFAPIERRRKAIDACDYLSVGERKTGLYGYCLEPYPYDRNLKAPVADFEAEFAQKSKETFTSEGKRISYGYANYCLNWYPREKTLAQSINSTNGNQLAAFDKDNAYYCIEQGPVSTTERVNGDNSEHTHVVIDTVNARNSDIESQWITNRTLIDVGGLLTLGGGGAVTWILENGVELIVGAISPSARDELVKSLSKVPLANLKDVVAFKGRGASIGSEWMVPRDHAASKPQMLIVYSDLDKSVSGEPINGRNDDISQLIPARNEERISRDNILAIEYKLELSSRENSDATQYADWKNKAWQLRSKDDTSAEGKDFTFLLRNGHSKRNYQTCPGEIELACVTLPVVGRQCLCDNVLPSVTVDNLFINSQCDASGAVPGGFLGSGRTFIGIKPVFNGGVLSGWNWRYCDRDGSGGLETAYVSIKIHTYNTYNHEVKHAFDRSMCTKFIKVQDARKAITKFSQVQKQDANGVITGTWEKIYDDQKIVPFGAPGNDEDKFNTNDFKISPEVRYGETESDVEIAKRFASEPDDAKGHTSKHGIESDCNGKKCINPIVIQGGKITAGATDSLTVDLGNGNSIPLKNLSLKGFSYTPRALTPAPVPPTLFKDLPTAKSYFAKSYGVWNWSGGYHGSYSKNTTEDTLEWAQTKGTAIAPEIKSSAAIPIANRFTAEPYHNGKSLKVSFFAEVTQDQLPLKQYVIDWGNGTKDYLKNPAYDEGLGEWDRKSNATPVNPYVYNREWIYVNQTLIEGRVICVYAVDNWGAKRAVCGKFVKAATGKFEIPDNKWCTKTGTYDKKQEDLISETRAECQSK